MIEYLEIGLDKLSFGLLTMAKIHLLANIARNVNKKLLMLFYSRLFAFICG
jgi:hypothetical protein